MRFSISRFVGGLFGVTQQPVIVSKCSAATARAFLLHHLQLFGVQIDGLGVRWDIFTDPTADTVGAAQRLVRDGGLGIIASTDAVEVLAQTLSLGVARERNAPALLRGQDDETYALRRLRTLHPYRWFDSSRGQALVVDGAGRPVWLFVREGAGGYLLLGTEVAADLLRYRQGDPAAGDRPRQSGLGGIVNERPIYLFEDQLAGEEPWQRHADWWGECLARAVVACGGVARKSMLPKGAPGAIVITGDDDQAQLANYEKQLELLNGAPITYFLHPLTKHTPETLRDVFADRDVDLGLHPDSLDAPTRYGERMEEQAAWFQELTGHPPISVRNHGFLNQGYWEHLPHWRRAGVRISSNVPGIDGRALNGSFLPARMIWDDELTEHWSILTTIGDGVVFISGAGKERQVEIVLETARRIRESGIPGVMVLNLHPDNVDQTEPMHRAVREVMEGGFHAWTLAECLEWFSKQDSTPA